MNKKPIKEELEDLVKKFEEIEKEEKKKTVNVRKRHKKETVDMTLKKFLDKIIKEINQKK